jgi:hypothetical protein
MSSTDQLKDSLEATTPRGDLVAWSKLAADELDEEKGKIISDNRTKLSAYAAHFKPSYYVSCWHLNDHENWRMWERYTKGPNAVAIRTTLPLFRRSLSPSIGIGIVGYIDYSTEHLPTSLNMFEYIMHKNITFSFGQELRAVACELTPFGRRRTNSAEPFLRQREQSRLENLRTAHQRSRIGPSCCFASCGHNRF